MSRSPFGRLTCLHACRPAGQPDLRIDKLAGVFRNTMAIDKD